MVMSGKQRQERRLPVQQMLVLGAYEKDVLRAMYRQTKIQSKVLTSLYQHWHDLANLLLSPRFFHIFQK